MKSDTDSDVDEENWEEVPEVDYDALGLQQQDSEGVDVNLSLSTEEETGKLKKAAQAAYRRTCAHKNVVHTLCLVARIRHLNRILNHKILRAVVLSKFDSSSVIEEFGSSKSKKRIRSGLCKLQSIVDDFRRNFAVKNARGRDAVVEICSRLRFTLLRLLLSASEGICFFDEHCSLDILLLLGCVLRNSNYKIRIVLKCCPVSVRQQMTSNLSKAGFSESTKKRNEPKPSNSNGPDEIIWLEVLERGRWITIHSSALVVDGSVEKECEGATYIIACSEDGGVQDVSLRYIDVNSHVKARLSRMCDKTWCGLLEKIPCTDSVLKEVDAEHMEQILSKVPLPDVLSAFKAHPVYVLGNDLKKYESIYPVDAPIAGKFRGHLVYYRKNVALLHSMDNWLKEAREIKDNEEPYKVVKGLVPMKLRREYIKAVKIRKEAARSGNTDDVDICLSMRPDLALYGYWQTQPYTPPVAVDGVVPRNKFGNVYMFHDCMLPEGCVHLRLPGLWQVAKRLGIDCADAHVGWDVLKAGSVPLKDGFIVCKESAELLASEWREWQTLREERSDIRRTVKAVRNWSRLARGLINLERVRERFKIQHSPSADVVSVAHLNEPEMSVSRCENRNEQAQNEAAAPSISPAASVEISTRKRKSDEIERPEQRRVSVGCSRPKRLSALNKCYKE